MALDYLSQGESLYKLGKYKEALEQYNKAVKQNPKDFKAFNKKGQCYFMLGNYKEALKCYDKAIALKPDYAQAYCNKGDLLHYAFQKNKEGLDCHDKAISLDPSCADWHISKGHCLCDLKRNEEAIVCLNRATELRPDAATFFCKGLRLYFLERYEEALNDFEKVISLNLEFERIHDYKGRVLIHMERYAEAVECFKQAISLQPNEPDFYCDLAKGLLRIGNDNEAFEAFRKVKEVLENKNSENMNKYQIRWIRKSLKQIMEFEMIIQRTEKILKHINQDNPVAGQKLQEFFNVTQEKKMKLLLEFELVTGYYAFKQYELADLKQQLLNQLMKLQGESEQVKLEIEDIQFELKKNAEELEQVSYSAPPQAEEKNCCNLF